MGLKIFMRNNSVCNTKKIKTFFVLILGFYLTSLQAVVIPPYVDTTSQFVDDAVAGCPAGKTTTFNITDDFTITDLNVGIVVEHTYRGDLRISVTSPPPASTVVNLIQNVGGTTENFNVLFDSDSPNDIATAPENTPHAIAYNGTNYEYTVNPPGGALSTFNLTNSVGLWTVTMCDSAGGDSGTWKRTSLEFTGDFVSTLNGTKSNPINADEDGNGYISNGDTLTYTVTATNTGGTVLNNVVVSDPLLTPNSFTCPTLAVGSDCILTGNYSVSIIDELRGTIDNTASYDSNETTLQNTNTVSVKVGPNVPTAPEDVFYMPLPEGDALTTFLSIVPASGTSPTGESCTGARVPASPISTYSSITVLRDNTILYYDQQEDGYEADTVNPVQATTEVWGDGVFANGVSPGSGCLVDACDILNAGIIIVLDNQITIPDAALNFDGGDKISATDTIAMTKANWAAGTGTRLAGAFELYPTSEWGTSYEIPVGQDIAPANFNNAKYQYVGLTIMAQQDGTIVTVDLDGNPGTVGDISTVTLNEGQSTFIDGGIKVGATVVSNFNVQVDIMTGDICDNYESRFFTLFPTALWDNSYYNPVGTAAGSNGPVRVLLYNPGPNDITVLIQDGIGSATQLVTAGTLFDYLQNSATAAHYCTTTDGTTCDVNGDVFYAMAGIDADPDALSTATSPDGDRNDWGFTLVPKSSLSQQALVGLGFGQDPTKTLTEDSSPVWITADMVNNTMPIGGIQICVDYDNDGTDTGPPLIDPVTGQQYDTTFSVNLYDSTQIRDTDQDQTSLLVWICDTDVADANNAIIAVAWGQDPSTASAGAPAIDLGTGVPNVASLALKKKGQLSNDINGDGFPSIGDTITYLIALTNVGFVPVDGEVLTDNLPASVTYVPGSTIFDNSTGVGFVSIADSAVPPAATLFPLDEGGVSLPGLVQVGKTFYVSFDVIINSLPIGDFEMCNATSVNIPIEVVTDEHCLALLARTSAVGNFVWNDLNQNGIQDVGETGIEGVTVSLLDASGNPVLDGLSNPFTTTTAADGSWAITGLSAGDYQVRFDTSTATDNLSYSLTAQNQGADDTLDSDAGSNGIQGQSQTTTFTLIKDQINNDLDAGFIASYSVIGNRVWLDLDNDGVQDANEDGIANRTVQLTPPAGIDLGAGVGIPITTVTDVDGNYIFNHLPIANGYVVTVTNPPVGLTQSYDEDGTATANTSVVNLTTPNQEYLTADFGYAPSSGTVGDYIWSDVNGDGQQDPGEIGLAGVTVYLCTAANSSPCNAASVGVVTTTTDATGKYLFTGLTLTDTYVVEIDSTALLAAGYTQTGDPDGTVDNETTVPPLNGSNNINLDADFGYQPPTTPPESNNFSDIGDTVFNDLNGNGVQDAGELGVPGVTVQLFVAGGGPIASIQTDVNGMYLFPSLPNGFDYTVLITDTNNVLNNFVQTADPDATLDNKSTLLNLAADNLNQDFGYKPIRAGTGVIGDRIFHDIGTVGIQDALDQGLEGVVVTLTNNLTGDFIATTTTDENGNYIFSGLDATLTYKIKVDTTTLPNGGVGWSNNIDPDAGTASESVLDLSVPVNNIDLAQDFGYISLIENTIMGTIWADNDGNGTLTDGTGTTPNELSNGIDNVTVVLTDLNGNVLATTTSDVNGDYSFTNLPNGSYRVIVTDKFNQLANMRHTDGPSAGTNNNSQDDTGYLVAVSGGVTNDTADFGYQPVVTTPITLGSFKALYNKGANNTEITWTTVTESGNVGFELYFKQNGVWEKANDKLIPSKHIYHLGKEVYSYTFVGDYAKEWAIVDIDIMGIRQSHGTYKVNTIYGVDNLNKSADKINWSEFNRSHEEKEVERNQLKINEINNYIQQNKGSSKGAGK